MMASSFSTRRPAPARRSCSCTSLPAIIAAGNRIAYSARGYPPSDVPEDVERYSQARARDDIRCVLDALGIQRAHVVGLSMGAFATLHFGITYGYRAL